MRKATAFTITPPASRPISSTGRSWPCSISAVYRVRAHAASAHVPAGSARRAAAHARAERVLSSLPEPRRPLMPRRDFHFAGHALRVEAAEEPLAWLHEFIAPQFAARDTDAPDRTIALIYRRARTRAARGPWASPRAPHAGLLHARLRDPRTAVSGTCPAGQRWFSTGRARGVLPAPARRGCRWSRSSRPAMTPTPGWPSCAPSVSPPCSTRRCAGWLMLHAAAVCVG